MRSLKALAAFAVLALAACGGPSSTVGQDGFGNLQVQVAGIHNGSAPDATDVADIVLTLEGVDHSYTRNLTDSTPNWATTFEKIYTGSYAASAVAHNASGEVIFQSVPQMVTILKDTTVGLVIVMNQQTKPGSFVAPYIKTVIVDRMNVEQGEDILVTVTADGGSGDLTLSGRHATSNTNPGTFSAPATFVDGAAQISWTSPMVAGAHWFVLVVTDDEGNKAELGVTVLVGADRGSLLASVSFNLAPTFTVTTRVLNDGDASTTYFWVNASDSDSTGALSYEWTTTCQGVNWYTNGYAASTGTIGASQLVFKVDIAGQDDREANNGECSYTLTVSDSDGASAAEVISVKTLETEVAVNP